MNKGLQQFACACALNHLEQRLGVFKKQIEHHKSMYRYLYGRKLEGKLPETVPANSSANTVKDLIKHRNKIRAYQRGIKNVSRSIEKITWNFYELRGVLD